MKSSRNAGVTYRTYTSGQCLQGNYDKIYHLKGIEVLLVKKHLILGFLVFILAACNEVAGTQQATAPTVIVYKSPTWGCCGDWGEYLEDNGFKVEEINTNDLTSIKTQHQVPTSIQSCHTAIVDGYVIEGHVPATEIRRLLVERPAVVGIAVAGMPAWERKPVRGPRYFRWPARLTIPAW